MLPLVTLAVAIAASGALASGAPARGASLVRHADTPPRVVTDAGTVEGMRDSATKMIVFRGLPYAAPPVGPLRFRPPKPATPWRGVRQATQLGHNCMQTKVYSDIDAFAAGVSEDCLYLNVWTKSIAHGQAKRPVMVWIHGGGFHSGFGGEERHDGSRLAQKGAVVVTVNYRLGPLGFLAHPALAAGDPHHSSGNYGLLDQIAALQWVKHNIARFGGDPARVTIFGESAGGMSVGSLVGSPLARGLFQRAILESGVGTGAITQRRDSAAARGERYAAALGITGEGPDAARALRAVSADTLLAAVERAGPPSADGRPNRFNFSTVVDGWVLPQPVDSALLRGTANLVPVIVGSNGDEGDAFFGAPARAFARLVTAHHQRAYLYLFTRVGEDSASRARGAYHSSEITFVFGRPHPLQSSAGSTPYDSTLAESMSDYWVAFATTGDPNGPPTRGRHPVWPVYDAKTDAYIEFGPQVVARQAIRRAVYDSIDVGARGRGEVRP